MKIIKVCTSKKFNPRQNSFLSDIPLKEFGLRSPFHFLAFLIISKVKDLFFMEQSWKEIEVVHKTKLMK